MVKILMDVDACRVELNPNGPAGRVDLADEGGVVDLRPVLPVGAGPEAPAQREQEAESLRSATARGSMSPAR